MKYSSLLTPSNQTSKQTKNTGNGLYLIQRRSFPGKVSKVIDGDTIEVDGIPVRLVGINAPEKGFPGSWKVIEYLVNQLGDDEVLIEVYGEDNYGRVLGVVWKNIPGSDLYININANLLHQKMAIPYGLGDVPVDQWMKSPPLGVLRRER